VQLYTLDHIFGRSEPMALIVRNVDTERGVEVCDKVVKNKSLIVKACLGRYGRDGDIHGIRDNRVGSLSKFRFTLLSSAFACEVGPG
jgi:hypothetical protein